MKTTVDLPEAVLHRAKIAAAQRKTTLKDLMILGLQMALNSKSEDRATNAALDRLRKGLSLGGKPLTRAQTHER